MQAKAIAGKRPKGSNVHDYCGGIAAKESVDVGLESDIDTGLAVERTWFAGLFATEDRRTGMRSFGELGPGKAKFR